MIYLTGDTHAHLEILRLFDAQAYPKNVLPVAEDYVIVMGDFGLVWEVHKSGTTENMWLNKLDEQPWTTLFVDGNHENFDRLDKLPTKEFAGGTVGIVRPNVLHLKRGEIFTLENKTFFVMGGGLSVDKIYRTEHLSWWKREIPCHSEYEHALNNLDRHNNKTDYILTHSPSVRTLNKLGAVAKIKRLNRPNSLDKFLEEIEDLVTFKHWYFGHMHTDLKLDDQHTCLYKKILCVTGEPENDRENRISTGDIHDLGSIYDGALDRL